MSNIQIGERFKNNYEHRQRFYLIRRMPVIIRIDGRAFHTFTKKLEKPFCPKLIDAFVITTSQVSKEMSGFKLAYHQSDEVSFLLTDYDSLETEAWFGYNKSKLESITASLFTAAFNKVFKNEFSDRCAIFDARAFNIPKEEIVNYFLWRALDWRRNSVSMYCQKFFSHKQMLNKGMADQHEMLYSIGKNWSNDLTRQEKNGTYISKENDTIYTSIQPNYLDIKNLIEKVLGDDY